MSRYAIHATAELFGEIVEDRTVPPGKPLRIGRSAALDVPVPEGWPHFASVTWQGADKVLVTEGSGHTHELGPEGEVVVEAGPVRVRLSLVPQFRLRRLPPLAAVVETALGIALLLFVIAPIGLLTEQGQSYGDAWCVEVHPRGLPMSRNVALREMAKAPVAFTGMWRICDFREYALAQEQPRGDDGRGHSQDRVAEYLQRLLAKDLDGEEQGVLEAADKDEGDREGNDIYLPAGDGGPTEEMGGADEVAPTPERGHSDPEEQEARPDKKEQPLVADEGVGTVVDLPEAVDDAIADAEAQPDDPTDADELAETTGNKEEKRGFGLKDWYDTETRAQEQTQIDLMQRVAKHILRINPNDAEALSLLSYYQYLNEDFDDAQGTYDKFIELFPDDPAGYNNKALVYKRLGRYDEELALYEKALELSPDDTTALNNKAIALSHQGRHDEALEIMDRLETLLPDDPYSDLHRAKVWAAKGDAEKAFYYLDKALQGMRTLDTLHHIEFRQDIRVDPAFDELRRTRRFHEILWTYYGDAAPVAELP